MTDTPVRFGKYEVVGKIGEGGFGSVYEGRDPQLKRRVAIKTLTADRPDLRERFLQEAEISAGLQHPNVVTVHDFGHQDDVPYLVQEFLSGEDLAHKIRRREAVSRQSRLAWLLQIARGLGHAHERGVIHRDVKPANVRILDDGQVKILDFGIAKLLETDRQLTQSGMAMGTLGYLPPEQIEGEPVDQRADLFSFGVLAYELLTYSKPFQGDHPSAVLYQIAHADPAPLSELWPECPPELADLIHRCLAKEPGERPRSFSEAVDVLARLGEPSSASLLTAAEAPTQPIAKASEDDLEASSPSPPPPPLSFLSDAYKTAIGPRGRRVLGLVLMLAVLGALAITGWRHLEPSDLEFEEPVPPEESVDPQKPSSTEDVPDETPGGGDVTAPEPAPSLTEPTAPSPNADPTSNDPASPPSGTNPAPPRPMPSGPRVTSPTPDSKPPEPAPAPIPGPPGPPSNPRFLVLLEGLHEAVTAGESGFIDEVLGADFPVVDAGAVERLKTDEAALAKLRGEDASQIAHASRQYGADIVVVGRLTLETQPAIGKFHTGRATLSYKAYRASTGEYLGAGASHVGGRGTPGKMEPSPGQAAAAAAEAAGRQAARAVLEKVGSS